MKQNKESIILGITGGIGSGKSTVSGILEELGAIIIDADAISRQIVMPGEEALSELVLEFGADILDESGYLNRKKLADIVFNNTSRLEKLNGIMHNYVEQRIIEEVNKGLENKTGIIVIDAPIPVKAGFLDLSDNVWTVTAPMETRIERVMKRSGMTYDEALARIKSQISDEDYIKIADTVINNNKDIQYLKQEVLYRYSRFFKVGGYLEKKD